MTKKRNRKASTKQLRRNRQSGVVVLALLILAGCGYYHYCIGTELYDMPMRNPKGVIAATKSSLRASTLKEKNSPKPPSKNTFRPADPCQSSPLTTRSEGVGNDSATGGLSPTDAGDHISGSLELPAFDADAPVIYNFTGRYTLRYDTLYRQASWVAYLLTRADVTAKSAKRKNKFVPDPEVVKRGFPTARTSYYTGSGYDRGHLCPSADRTRSQQENDCTFLLSNISPQTPELNRGVWKELEEQVRAWAIRYDSLYVVTGGVLKPGLRTISKGVGVPDYFYKAVLTRQHGVFHAVAFLIPNDSQFEGDYEHYAVCVDSLQSVTSTDFFPNLPDRIEVVVESSYSSDFWFE